MTSDAEQFLAAALRRSTMLLIEGPAGIGKTHRWTSTLDRAVELGWRVLGARPSEAETRVGGIALIDLLTDVGPDELNSLPEPQRAALETALLRRPDDGGATEPGRVCVGFTNLIRQLATEAPLIVAVDDVQWVDALTASCLDHLSRRLPQQGVGLVIAARSGETVPAFVASPDTTLPVERCSIEPLAAAQVEAIVRDRVSTDLSRRDLTAIARTSGGNPFFALELARHRSGHRDGNALPQSLQSMVSARIRALPDDSRRVVQCSAILSRPSVTILERLGWERTALAEAERADILTVRRDEIRFTHPLLAAAAYDMLTGTERSALHSLVAAAVDDVEEHALHTALGAPEPDERIAVLLDQACERARRRGDLSQAVEFAQLAVQATPADLVEAWCRRRLHLASLTGRSGDVVTALGYLDELAETGVPESIRAEALLASAPLLFFTDTNDAVHEAAQRALTIAIELDDLRLQAAAHLELCSARADRTAATALQHAELALQIADQGGVTDPVLRSELLTEVASCRFSVGQALDHDMFARAIDLLGEQPERPPFRNPSEQYAVSLMMNGDLDEAADVLTAALRRCTDEGRESDEAYLLYSLAVVALNQGNLDDTRTYVQRLNAAAQRTGQINAARHGEYALAMLALADGDIASAAKTGEHLCADAESNAALESLGLNLRALAALYECNYAEVLDLYDRFAVLDPTHIAEIRIYLLEALAGLGLLDRARSELEVHIRTTRERDRRCDRPDPARCEAIVLAAEGHEDAAIQAFDESLSHYPEFGWYPIERAHTLLLKGRTLRRFRRKAAARDAFLAAREVFDRMGSSGWVGRVDVEIARIGLRHAAPDELTETEQRVAELAANGLTSKQVAAQLYISPKTVEANLSRVYRKLGISSRAELGARLAAATAAGTSLS